jgi:hypothetical protein
MVDRLTYQQPEALPSSGLMGGAYVSAGGGCRGITRESSIAAHRARGINASRMVGRVTSDFQNNIAGDQESLAKINIHTLRTIEEDVPVE